MQSVEHNYENEMVDGAFLILYAARHCMITKGNETIVATRAKHITSILAFEFMKPIDTVIDDIRYTQNMFDLETVDQTIEDAINGKLH